VSELLVYRASNGKVSEPLVDGTNICSSNMKMRFYGIDKRDL
jgi:hypothetical protein